MRAGEVRRRLELYYADTNVESDILVQIPLGSYAPVFRLRRDSQAHKTPASETAGQERIGAEAGQLTYVRQQDVRKSGSEDSSLGYDALRSTEVELPLEASTAGVATKPKFHEPVTRPEAHSTFWPKSENRWRAILMRAVLPVLACVALLAYLITSHLHRPPESALKAFWLPASLSSKPVLLCMPKGVHVVMAGLDSAGKSTAYWQSLRRFWNKYSQNADATVDRVTVLKTILI